MSLVMVIFPADTFDGNYRLIEHPGSDKGQEAHKWHERDQLNIVSCFGAEHEPQEEDGIDASKERRNNPFSVAPFFLRDYHSQEHAEAYWKASKHAEELINNWWCRIWPYIFTGQ